MISDLVNEKIDILFISETKIGNPFPTPQFAISSFSFPYRLDRSQQGGGLLLYVREDIPSKTLQTSAFSEVECLAIEINLQKEMIHFRNI